MMQPAPRKAARCAIYTRKSTEHNLDLEFNSLDAQREACEAYIKSQAHEAWRLIRTRYDDGGLSGASLDRPALQDLLDDVRARKVCRLQGRPADPLARRLRQAGGTLRPAFRLVRLDHPVLQYGRGGRIRTSAFPKYISLNCLTNFGPFRKLTPGDPARQP
jgi:site-specific DNA recombinase